MTSTIARQLTAPQRAKLLALRRREGNPDIGVILKRGAIRDSLEQAGLIWWRPGGEFGLTPKGQQLAEELEYYW